MKTNKIISEINGNSLIHIYTVDNDYTAINYNSIDSTNKSTIDNFFSLCDKLSRESKQVLGIPSTTPAYIMDKPCPVDSGLTCNIYDMGYSNDRINQIIKIDVLAVHFDSNGNRVPEWDTYSYVLADMSDENKVEVSDGVYEHSYTLADTMLSNGTSVPSLIQTAIHIADVDGTLNKRLYGL